MYIPVYISIHVPLHNLTAKNKDNCIFDVKNFIQLTNNNK